MNQTAFQAIAVSLVQKGLIAGGTALLTYLGTQGDVAAAAAALAPIIVGVAWGLYNKLASRKVAVAADAAGIDVKQVAKGTTAQAVSAGVAAKA